MNKINIKDVAGGALQEQFQKSFEKIIENLKDVNTSFKPKRKMIMTMTFEQDEAREQIVASVAFQEKLAPRNAVNTMYSVGHDLRTGKVRVEEFGIGVIPGQMQLSDYVAEQTIDGKIIDTDTGEIIGESQPRDLRKEA